MITSKTVRKGQWIQDEYFQKCQVVEKTADKILTKRYDETGPWEGVATWTYNDFDAQRWTKARPSKKAKQ